ncbi:MAG: SCO family protein [Steroidobacteraceae bacterium]
MAIARTLLASLAILTAGATAFGYATDGLRAFTSESARRLEIRDHPRIVPPSLALETADGARVEFSALQGRWVLVDFIYTRCPTWCSVLGSEFAQLERQLSDAIGAGRVQLLSISFDPAHDTPARLADYQRRFGASGNGWIAARPADEGALDSLMRAFAVTAIPDGFGGYVHNAAILVVDPAGRLVRVLDADDAHGAAAYVRARLEP